MLEAETVAVEPTGEVPIVIAAELQLRIASAPIPPAPAVLRADLFSPLFRGRIEITVGEHAREMQDDVFVFVVAEQLAAITLEALEAWSRGRPYYRRLTVGGAICGVKLGSEGAASLTLGLRRRPSESRTEAWTFPAVDVGALAQGVVAFGRALTRSLQRRDRAQTSNVSTPSAPASASSPIACATRPATTRRSTTRPRATGPSPPRCARPRPRRTSAAPASASAAAGSPRCPSIDLRSTFLVVIG